MICFIFSATKSLLMRRGLLNLQRLIPPWRLAYHVESLTLKSKFLPLKQITSILTVKVFKKKHEYLRCLTLKVVIPNLSSVL